MTAPFRACGLVPTYDNPRTVRSVIERLRTHVADVFVIDDGSGPDGQAACAAMQRDGLATVHRLPRNRGKGAALKAGFRLAHERGFTHALQVDADGQHDLDAAAAFLRAAAAQPEALVLAFPVYDESAPAVRLAAHKLARFWVDFEVGRRGLIRDALIGFRVYPLASTLRIGARGNRMEYEVEIAVRMARAGVPILNLPVGIRYLASEQGGVSHFRPLRDNLWLSWMHARICTAMSFRACFGWLLPRRE